MAVSLTENKVSYFESFLSSALIKGLTYFDANQNQIFDTGETILQQHPLTLEPDHLVSWTNGEGCTQFVVHNNAYTLSCEPLLNWSFTTPSFYDIDFTGAPDDVTAAFGLYPNQEVFAGEVVLEAAATRCGFVSPFWLTYNNSGTVTSDATIEIELDPLVSFVDAFPAPDNIDGQTLSWEIANLPPTHSGRIGLQLEMPGVDELGNIINIVSGLSIENESGEIVANTTHDFSSVINCAYDPNDKASEPYFEGYENYTRFEDTLNYTIRFQNTGTDTAFNVRLEDVLDPALDWSTFEVIAASHPYEVRLEDDGRLLFYFNDILLPDSTTNWVASNGFVKYAIQARTDVPEMTHILNQASIYFDFNPPILTNQTDNLLVDLIPVFYTEIEPDCFDSADGEISIDFPLGSYSYSWDNGADGTVLSNIPGGAYTISIVDDNGNLVSEETIELAAPAEMTLNISGSNATDDNMDGSAMVAASGGVLPYAYSWNTEPVQTESSIDNLAPGTYMVTVTDANNCEQVDSIVIDQVTALGEDHLIGDIFHVFPNPSYSGNVNIQVLLPAVKKWELSISNALGQKVIVADGNQNAGSQQTDFQITSLRSGIYTLSLEVDHRIYTKRVIVVD